MKTNKQSNLAITGFFLLGVGVVLFAKKIGVEFPEWLFSWEMILIVVGCYLGMKKGCRGISWLILITIGGVFLADEMRPELHIFNYAWPVVIILIGLMLLIKSLFKPSIPSNYWNDCTTQNSISEEMTSEDVLNSVTVFSGVKKVILSKNFKGGDMVSFMAGCEFNFSQADIQGKVTLNVSQVFSGVKIIVPPHWIVQSELVSVMGGFQDRRPQANTVTDPDKVLVIKGVNLLSGIDIKSF